MRVRPQAKPTSAYQRFRALPAGQVAAALDGVFDVHARLATAGYVAVDFYDGSLLYVGVAIAFGGLVILAQPYLNHFACDV